MKVITEKELLDFCYKNAKVLAKSQFLDIDENYILNGNTRPIIKFRDELYYISISIKYNTKPIHELNLIATKWIVKDGKYVDFEKVVP